MQSYKIRGFIPRVLTIYFLAQYIFYMVAVQYGIRLEYINLPMITLLFLYVVIKTDGNLGRNWILIYIIYICLLTACLSFTTFFAPDQKYSILRILMTCWILFSLMIVFFYTVKKSHDNVGWGNAISISLLLILLIAGVGQIILPEWEYGMRLSGGVNPNGMGYMALFCNFWFMYQIASGHKGKLLKIGWLLSIVLMLWTMSRTILLSVGVLYITYLLFVIATKAYKVNIKKILSFLVLTMTTIGLFKVIQNTLWYKVTLSRFSDTTNLGSRQSAWGILQDQFYSNMWVGGAGWWSSSSLLSAYASEARTSHNLYLRLLAETGLIGTIPVLVLPLIIFISLIYLGFIVKSVEYKRKIFLVSSMILCLFFGMGFEDRYLTGVGGFNTGPFIWVMAMGVFLMYDVTYVRKRATQ